MVTHKKCFACPLFRLHRVSKIHSVKEQPLKNWWKSRASILSAALKGGCFSPSSIYLSVPLYRAISTNEFWLHPLSLTPAPPPPHPTPSVLLLFPCTERMNRDGRGWNKSTGGKWRIAWGEQLIESKDRLASPSPEIPIQSNEKGKKQNCPADSHPKGERPKKKLQDVPGL